MEGQAYMGLHAAGSNRGDICRVESLLRGSHIVQG